MLHLVLYVLLAIVVAVGLFLVASRFLPAGEQIAPAIRDEPVWELPAERSLQAEDVDSVRLPVALRGYRFAETDVLLDRLAGELRARDAEIERLRGGERPAEPSGAAASPAPLAPTPDPAGVVPSGESDGDAPDHVTYAPPRPRPVAPARPDLEPAAGSRAIGSDAIDSGSDLTGTDATDLDATDTDTDATGSDATGTDADGRP